MGKSRHPFASAHARHGQHFIQAMADETGYNYAQLDGVVHHGMPVGKRLVKIVEKLPARPKQGRARNNAVTTPEPAME